ncbi:MAG TPA: glutamine--fructose-6-phosphate aminotransferase [Firmicutes bacterium]|jgi:glutamine---fructose-6-phosphate transaminase (isomerizing)|nr:glutamine--fructose-6-phosphate aminotransferase [Bacillota bacterium]
MVKMWKEIFEQPAVLEKCLSNTAIIHDVVQALKTQEIHGVYIAARGTSDHAAVYGKYLMESILGIPVALAASSVLTIYQKEINFKNTFVIGISQSGQAADVIEVVHSAKKQGAVTLSITNTADSPLAKEAQFHLDCHAGVEESVAATKTFTAQMFLLAQFVSIWAANKHITEELIKVPEKVSQTLTASQEIINKVDRYRFISDCFVLARGINYAVSLEAALKIKETNYIRAEAFSSSDFQHGPIAAIDRNIPVMIFAPKGPSLADMTEMIKKLRDFGIELIIISNQKELFEYSPCSFEIPNTENDLVSPFFNVVIAQMFACQLALVRGLNPDQPRGLHKVTITK